jgi:arabinan endo-1,5-alpha-L-arabinosidase
MLFRSSIFTFAFLLAAGLVLSFADPLGHPPQFVTAEGDISPVHDPVIIREKDTYYVFSTGGAIRKSKDLVHWTAAGKVFDKLPAWATTEIPGTRGGYWAPDVSFYKGVYRIYYAVSTFGKNESAIGLVTNQTLDAESPGYRWVDQGMVLRSHRGDDFNAIDPNLVTDKQGRQWLDFGSFWSGIKMRRIDPKTGKLFTADNKLYSLASHTIGPFSSDGTAGKNSIEAPFIVYRRPYYYLFVSLDYCCRGAKSTYYVAVGRARNVTGPYIDAQGKRMDEGGGTRLTSPTSLWRGPGHEGLLLQPHGPDLMVFHAYDAVTGKPSLQISTIDWRDGWPQIAPLPGQPASSNRVN